ncbi:MAG: WbqC family protein, partial [Desulfobacterales bacterium]
VLSSECQIHGRGVPRVFALIEMSQCDTFLVEQKYANYLSQNKWLEKRVKIQYFKSPTPVYHQQFDDFTDGLSVVDLLFNEGEMSREILMGP